MNDLKWPQGVFPEGVPDPRPGELTVIAAPRRSGKTTFAVELAKTWGRERKVVLCVPRIETLPKELRRWPPDLFRIAIQRGSISDLLRDLRSDFGPCGVDVLIIDEIWLDLVPVFGPGDGKLKDLKELAQALRIPVVAIVNRSSAVDAVLAADSLLVTDGRVACATPERGCVGMRWFGGAHDERCR